MPPECNRSACGAWINRPYKIRPAACCVTRLLGCVGLLYLLLLPATRIIAQVSNQANYNPNGYDATLTLRAFEHPYKDLVIVIGHRGAHALINGEFPKVPENSLQSIRDAASAGWEAVEIDVKNTSDGIPILTHDYTWGRETCGFWSGGHQFNPFTSPDDSNNAASNPDVVNIPLSQTRRWFSDTTTLRDSITLQQSYFQGCSGGYAGLGGEYPPTLTDVLNDMRQKRIALLLTLDIKDAPTAAASWKILQNSNDFQGRPYSESVIIKVPARAFKARSDYDNAFPIQGSELPHLFPYYNTGDIRPAVFGSESALYQNMAMVESNPNIALSALEIVLKQYNGILSQTLANVQSFYPSTNVSNFSPYGERTTPADPNTPEYFTNRGYCAPCDTLANYYYNGSPNNQPSDTADMRGNKDFITYQEKVNSVTADDTADWINYLSQQGLHNTSYLISPGAASSGVVLSLDGDEYIPTPNGSYTLIATLSSATATGSVIFYDNGNQVGTGTVLNGNTSLVVGNIANASHTYTATYSGDSNNPSVSSNSFNVTPESSASGPGSEQGGPGGTADGGTQLATVTSGTTYTINANGMSFTTTQPTDSVATFSWRDGGGTPVESITSANGSSLGYALTPVNPISSTGTGPSATVTVDVNSPHQTIDGFGAAMTDSAAYLIGQTPKRDEIMNLLFSTTPGSAGLTFVRSPMGSSDMMASGNDIHTYQDGSNFSTFAYDSDKRQIDLLRQAAKLAGSSLKIIGTPWTSPGRDKNDGSLLPPQCGTDQNEFSLTQLGDYANYFKNYIAQYQYLGIKPWAISMQNEPENCKTGMPTTLFSANDEIRLAQYLKFYIPNDVKILGWDHNWNDEDYVNTLTQSGVVDIIGYHCYDGTHYGNQTRSVPTYMTECSGFTPGNANVAQNLGFEVANLLMGPMRYGTQGSLYWSLAQDPNGNPHLNSGDACQNCRGMITVNPDGTYTPSQDFYYYAQFSAFVPPGSVRVDSNNAGDLSSVAFHHGNQTTLVVLNSSTHADGGTPSNDEENLVGHIVQWDGDQSAQKAAWFVGADGYRRYINDGSTYNCLVYDAGYPAAQAVPSGALDKYINLLNVWAVCNTTVMGTNSELEVGTYLKSAGGARLTLTSGQLYTLTSNGTYGWTPGKGGDRLILQKDGNLVLYQGQSVQWASNTVGSGAIYLVIRDDGSIALFDVNNNEVWNTLASPLQYRGKMVQWDQDSNSQKTSWQVGWDQHRRYVPDLATFQCLHDTGAGNSNSVSSDTLN